MGTIALKATAGGSVQLKADDALTTDEVIVVQDPIGVNQTWQDVTASRVDGVLYTNTTGRPIQVSWSGTGDINGYSTIVIDTTITLFGSQIYANTAFSVLSGIIIPNGSTYKINYTAGINSAVPWSELREVV